MIRTLPSIFLTFLSFNCFSAPVFNLAINQDCLVAELPTMKAEFVIYKGSCINGKANGYSEVRWFNKNRDLIGVTTGIFTNGVLGGSITYSNYKDKFIYTGEIVDGLFNGVGTYITEYLSYKGLFKNGEYSGYGMIEQSDGTLIKGWFREDKLNGYGHISFKSGLIKEGNFIDWKLNGYGIEKYPNGGRYEGSFKNGSYDGLGILFKPNGEEMPVAFFANGKFLQVAGSTPRSYFSDLSQLFKPSIKISEDQENELSSKINRMQPQLERSRSVNIISPNGSVSTGTMWSNKPPGSVGLGGGTFIQLDK